MARRTRKTLWPRSLQRQFDKLTRTAFKAGAKAVAKALQPPPALRRRAPRRVAVVAKPLVPRTTTRAGAASTTARAPEAGEWTTGIATTPGGARRYRLYRPPGIRRDERLPLLVMLHGCDQDVAALAASTRMNRIAARERFMVLYPEQDRLHNGHGCWNWFETRSGRAQAEVAIIDAAVRQACLRHPVDPARIALAGFSAGAGMAALVATRHPQRYRAVAMHSGVGPGAAHSSATALGAMRGRRAASAPPIDHRSGPWPALLVVQGSVDRVVASSNGSAVAALWAHHAGAAAGKVRAVQRGKRRPASLTDYRAPDGRLVATLCEVQGLGHAWSGGAARQRYSDPQGPDASIMIWRFCARCFAAIAQPRPRDALDQLTAKQ